MRDHTSFRYVSTRCFFDLLFSYHPLEDGCFLLGARMKYNETAVAVWRVLGIFDRLFMMALPDTTVLQGLEYV